MIPRTGFIYEKVKWGEVLCFQNENRVGKSSFSNLYLKMNDVTCFTQNINS